MTATILVIDDSEDDQRLYQRAFKDFNSSFSLVMASSAEAGFARIADARPDLILLDYNLPDMDGLSFMKRLSEYSDTTIPIVMLTGEGSTAVAVEAMKHGADDYLVKDTGGRHLKLLPGVVERVMATHVRREQTRSAEELMHELRVHQIQLEMQNEELRKAQVTIEESRDRYEDLYEFAPVGYLTLTRNGMIAEVNLTGAALLGLERKKLLNRRFARFVTVGDRDQWNSHFLSVFQSDVRQSCELALRREDDSVFHAQLDCLHMRDGGVSSMRIAFSDITERKRMQLETEMLLRRNQVLMTSSMDGIHVLDIQGNLVDFNDAFCRMLGYSREEMAGFNVAEWSAEFSGEASWVRFSDHIGQSVMIETLCHRKDGTLLNVEISVAREETNGQILLFCSSRDITERKRAEVNMRAMLDNSPYLSWLKDMEGHYTAANKMFADYLRLEDADQIIGKTDLDLWPTELAEKYRADDAEVMAARQQKHFEERVLEGSNLLWVETFKAPIIDSLGNVMGTVGIARDITERKKAEEELRLENETGRKRSDELAQQFGYLLQSSFNEIYLFDANSMKFILTSEGAEKNLDYSDEELNQLTPLDLKPSYTRESFEELIAPLRSGEQQALLFDTFHRRKDGTTYPVEVRLQLMEAESPMFLAIVQDITERKEAEQNKKKLTRALKLLSECDTLVIHAKNEQQLLEETCQLAVVTGGYMMAWVGLAENDEAKTVRPIAQSGYEDGYLDGIKVTWSDTEFGQGPTGTAIRTGVVVVTQNCQTVPRMAPWREALIKRGYQSSIALPLVRNKRVFAALTIYSAEPGAFSNEEAVLLEELASNFSFGIETLRTREAQARAEQESRALSKHLQTVREEEKASFAREIHDELGGTLAALKMDAHWLAGKLPAGKETRPLQECAKSMIGLLDTAVLATRRIITDLRPTLLDDLGLMEALKWQSAQFQKRTGIECRFACAGGEDCEDRLDKVQSINLFRIFQETLTNVARHSGATRVEANLRHDDKEAALTISDNGRGLPEGHTIASTSYGLRGMRERVAQLGGKIKIDAPPGGGFRVKVILPLPAGNEK